MQVRRILLSLSALFTLSIVLLQTHAHAVEAVQPAADGDVVEVLPAVTRQRAAPVPAAPKAVGGQAAARLAPRLDAADAARLARQDISVARQTGETRYWGRAEAALAPWWNKPDAPPDLAVLQATVQQGRHEFEASRTLLTAVLARAPGHAQGWLNLAALERLSGRYAASLAACDAVLRAGQTLYAEACRLETESLQGRQAMANARLQALLAQTTDPGQRSWLLSLQAESLEREGRDAAAAQAYNASLAAEHDLYTAIALSDLQLRTGKTAEALRTLTPLPATDAVVLRIATAHKRLGDAGWSAERETLKTRVEELRRRGDDVTLHGRELALAALWLDGDAAGALALARGNLRLQKEPVDWWIAFESARQAGDTAAQLELNRELAATGLKDARLSPAGKKAKP